MKKSGRTILVVLTAWALFTMYMVWQARTLAAASGSAVPWARVLFSEITYSGLWALLTPLVLLLSKKFPFEKGIWIRNLGIHAVAGIAISAAHKGVHGILFAWYRMQFDDVPFSWASWTNGLVAYIDYGVLLYWLVVLIAQALAYYRRNQEQERKSLQLEAQLARAQVQALRMQLHPHFLFNTLNAISVLIQKEPEKARRTLARLSDLLRMTLDHGASQEIPLSEELSFLEKYLQIEKTRYGSRLVVRMSIDPGAVNLPVPALILQPIVENAIKHGLGRRRGRVRVEIGAKRENGTLVLQVRDDGPGMPGHKQQAWKEGVGLSNTRERLRQLYGTAGSLGIDRAEGGGVVARIGLPVLSHTSHDKAPRT